MTAIGNITDAFGLRETPAETGLDGMYYWGAIDHKYYFFSKSGGEHLAQGALVKFTPVDIHEPWKCQGATLISPAIDRNAALANATPRDSFVQRAKDRPKGAGPVIE